MGEKLEKSVLDGFGEEQPEAWLVEHRAKGGDTPWLHYAFMKDRTRAEGLAAIQDPIVEYRKTALVRSVLTFQPPITGETPICNHTPTELFTYQWFAKALHDGRAVPHEPEVNAPEPFTDDDTLAAWLASCAWSEGQTDPQGPKTERDELCKQVIGIFKDRERYDFDQSRKAVIALMGVEQTPETMDCSCPKCGDAQRTQADDGGARGREPETRCPQCEHPWSQHLPVYWPKGGHQCRIGGISEEDTGFQCVCQKAPPEGTKFFFDAAPTPSEPEEEGLMQEDAVNLRRLAKIHDDDADNYELTGTVAVWLSSLADRIEHALAPKDENADEG